MQCETENFRMLRSRWIYAQPMLFSRPCPFWKDSQHLGPTSEASIMIYAALMLHTGYSLLLQVQSNWCLLKIRHPTHVQPIWGPAKILGVPKELARKLVCQTTWI